MMISARHLAFNALATPPLGHQAIKTPIRSPPRRIHTIALARPPSSSPPDTQPSFLSSIDFSEPMSFDGEEKTEYDPLRDGPLRYLGYANELGEAFASWLFTGGVPLSYAVAISYVLFDTWDKYRKTIGEADEKLGARKSSIPSDVDVDKLVGIIGLERGLDTLVWQLIASVAAPGYTIHTVVGFVSSLMKAAEAKSDSLMAGIHSMAMVVGVADDVFIETLNKSVPTAAGLVAIPFIVHPIDAGVHGILNASLRPVLRKYVCENGGCSAGLKICMKEK